MTQLYHHEYANSEHSTLPVISFVPSLMADSTWDASIPFDTHLRTMLDEIMMWCVTARLPEDLVRFLLSLLPDLNFKVVRQKTITNSDTLVAVAVHRDISTFLRHHCSIADR